MEHYKITKKNNTNTHEHVMVKTILQRIIDYIHFI